LHNNVRSWRRDHDTVADVRLNPTRAGSTIENRKQLQKVTGQPVIPGPSVVAPGFGEREIILESFTG